MNELIFVVEEAPEGGYTARALGESIFTEADDLAQLQEHVRDAVLCHFDAGSTTSPSPGMILCGSGLLPRSSRMWPNTSVGRARKSRRRSSGNTATRQ
jgi:hypothetical protein